MKTKFIKIFIITIFVMSSIVFVACGIEKQPTSTHMHSIPVGIEYNITDTTHSYQCSCGQTIVEPHTFGTGKECIICNYVEVESHSHTLIYFPSVEATCTKDGNMEYWYCNICDKYYSNATGSIETTPARLTIVAKGHQFNGGTTCLVCGLNVYFTEGLEYELIGDAYAVTGIGSATDSEIIFPSSYEDLPVTSISDSAFTNTNITGIVLSDTITSIGNLSFSGCSMLENITLTNSLEQIGRSAFENCTAIESIVIPNEVEVLNNSLFSGCISLTGVSIPNTLKEIDDFAFKNCCSLKNVPIPECIERIGFAAFEGSGLTNITLTFTGEFDGSTNSHFGYIFGARTSEENGSFVPKSLKNVSILNQTVIAEKAFYDCWSITNISLPSTLKTIGENAFFDCINITTATIPATAIAYIPQTSLRDVILNGGERIEDEAFFYSDIHSITIPKSINYVGDRAFGGRNNGRLEPIIYISDLAAWCNIDFNIADQSMYINSNLYYNGIPLRDLVIPDGVRKINSIAFAGCNSLEKVTISNSVEVIGEKAFYHCGKLNSVTLGNKVKEILDEAFYLSGVIEIYNSSALNLEIGSEEYGHVAFYASNIYTSSTGSKIYTTSDGFKLYADNVASEYYLLGYTGSETSITLPTNINGHDYEIYYEAFRCNKLIEHVIIPNGVTGIGESAFDDCSSLISVEMANSVTYIETDAFSNCTSLREINLSENIEIIYSGAFSFCTSLTSLIIPDNVKQIAPDVRGTVFEYCKNLIIYNLSDVTLDDIYRYDFLDMSTSLDPMTVTDSDGFVTYYDEFFDRYYLVGYVGESTDVVLPKNILGHDYIINDYVFYNNDRIESVTIPSSVTEIGEYAFDKCDSLNGVYIEDIASWCKIKFKNIYSNPLYYAGKLYLNGELVKNLVIPNTVEEIGSYQFAGCYSIENISISNSVESVGADAFYRCFNLVQTENGVHYVGNWAVSAIDDLVTAVIREGTVGIACEAFYDNDYGSTSNLTSITIPASVKYINYRAFVFCQNLQEVTFGANSELLSIGRQAFWYCSSLASITIPKNVVYIGARAFDLYQNYLTTAIFENTSNWKVSQSEDGVGTDILSSELTSEGAARLLSRTYNYYFWKRLA